MQYKVNIAQKVNKKVSKSGIKWRYAGIREIADFEKFYEDEKRRANKEIFAGVRIGDDDGIVFERIE